MIRLRRTGCLFLVIVFGAIVVLGGLRIGGATAGDLFEGRSVFAPAWGWVPSNAWNDGSDGTTVGYPDAYCDDTCQVRVDLGSDTIVTWVRLVQGSAYATSVDVAGIESNGATHYLGSYGVGPGVNAFGLTSTCACRYYRVSPSPGHVRFDPWVIFAYEGGQGAVPGSTPTVMPRPGGSVVPVYPLCGMPGEPPCRVEVVNTPLVITGVVGITGTVVVTGQVNIGNWPTAVPTSSPIGGPSMRETAISFVTGNGPVPVGGSATGASGLVQSSYGVGGPTTFIGYTEYDYGCPVNLGLVATSVCVRYRHIDAINMGPVEIPTWPFLAALALVVVGMVARK